VDTEACPVPELGISTVGYTYNTDTDTETESDTDTDTDTEWALIAVMFSTGFTEQPPSVCFTTGEELYFDSRIDFSIPDGGVVVSLPADSLAQPANLELDPIRFNSIAAQEYVFGDIFDGFEVDPNLTPVLAENPVLDGFARLCNIGEECDELEFTLEEMIADGGVDGGK
jgi:hypothetical protein